MVTPKFMSLREMALASCPSPLLIFLLTTLAATTVHSLPNFFPTAAQQSLAQQQKTSSPKDPKLPYSTHFFSQQLDHFTFRPNSYKLFNQKYLMNTTHWGGAARAAPIFVYTGNEGKIDWFAANTGFMMDIAPKFQALLVFIEHRFYGKSLPFGENSTKSAENLGYLSSSQALADYAVLIRSLKHNLSAEASPVVVFGGSYGGMLAAWFRLKYPHIAIGALSSSAPILQFDDITPWSSFYDAVSQDFKDESMNCFKVIKGSWNELAAVADQKDGLQRLSKIFKTCKGLKSADSVQNWLWTAFTYTAMVDYPTQTNFLMPLPANPVKEMCRIIDGLPPKDSKLTKAFLAASMYYNYTGSNSCFDVEHGGDPHGLDLWNYQRARSRIIPKQALNCLQSFHQTKYSLPPDLSNFYFLKACTEMVMPMTCTEESMFPLSTYDSKDFSDECMQKYGVRPRPHWITTEFGGKRIQLVLKRYGSNIIFSNGMKDPWSRGGVLKNISSSLLALVTQDGAHHLDLRSATKEDPEWVIEQRRQEVQILGSWIDQYHADYKAESSKM